ncbi:hypothetical protein Pmani_031969 [Petrolisthes manimaculis]|uniref:Uncharacterized protein n=1 Tax=Petrolisthes manimaculis TaxID=1843537 RepID=A0AAE1NU06_9EUCA|nr:hypothetical protein Pmani_031969 [Petrolisthes manimaculis]
MCCVGMRTPPPPPSPTTTKAAGKQRNIEGINTGQSRYTYGCCPRPPLPAYLPCHPNFTLHATTPLPTLQHPYLHHDTPTHATTPLPTPQHRYLHYDTLTHATTLLPTPLPTL